jgi:hypothetical protein
MNTLVESVEALLSEADFAVMRQTEGPFAVVAQNNEVIVFVVDVVDDLAARVRSIVSTLAKPFRSKGFGPKTMEMYCVFVANTPVNLEEIERYERDIRVCRKIVVTGEDDIASRLSFLRPLEEFVASPPSVATMFWVEVAKLLTPQEVEILRELAARKINLEDIPKRLPPVT